MAFPEDTGTVSEKDIRYSKSTQRQNIRYKAEHKRCGEDLLKMVFPASGIRLYYFASLGKPDERVMFLSAAHIASTPSVASTSALPCSSGILKSAVVSASHTALFSPRTLTESKCSEG